MAQHSPAQHITAERHTAQYSMLLYRSLGPAEFEGCTSLHEPANPKHLHLMQVGARYSAPWITPPLLTPAPCFPTTPLLPRHLAPPFPQGLELQLFHWRSLGLTFLSRPLAPPPLTHSPFPLPSSPPPLNPLLFPSPPPLPPFLQELELQYGTVLHSTVLKEDTSLHEPATPSPSLPPPSYRSLSYLTASLAQSWTPPSALGTLGWGRTATAWPTWPAQGPASVTWTPPAKRPATTRLCKTSAVSRVCSAVSLPQCVSHCDRVAAAQ